MRPQVLTTAISQAHFHDVCLVATDMDGTLTAKGEFTPGLLQAFGKLRDRNIKVMIVTGRSAGWVSGLVNYLPVVGAIAENGGIYIDKSNLDPVILPDIPRMSQHRGRLQNMFNRL
ncbi:MAG: HAD hydrolase family protein, partial [Cyanobacteria bacterium J06631_9]